MTEADEQRAMREYLRQHPCRCGRFCELTGSARYSDPIQWDFRCRCGAEGYVAFTDLSRTEIHGMVLHPSRRMQ